MNKIICDTHIWYYIEDGTIDLKSINPKYPLCSTYLTLNELLTTPKWFSEPERIFNVIKVMLENSSIVLCHPQLYVKNIAFNQDNQDSEILNRLKLCQEAYTDFKSVSSEKPIFTKWIEEVKKHKDFYESLGEDAKKYSMELRKRGLATNFKKQFIENGPGAKIHFENSITNSFNFFLGADVPISAELISQFELYNHVNNRFIKAVISEKYIVQENDFEDLDNLLYVQPNDLYWTKEKRWKILIKGANMSKYLFEE